MHKIGFFIFAFFFSIYTLAANPKGLVVLIPGTLNSLAPGDIRLNPISNVTELNPYFSEAVVQSFESHGFAVIVIHDLNPTGDPVDNGQIALDQIRSWYNQNAQVAKTPITLIGHSAGGLYALYAASEAKELPVQKVFMVATPLGGVEFANEVFSKNEYLRKFEEFCAATSPGFFDLRGLPAMTSAKVSAFLKTLRLSPEVQLYALAGEAPKSELFSSFDARNMSPFFNFTSEPITGPSDGMVSVSSAYSVSSLSDIPITPLKNIGLFLDHAKQVLDYRVFKALGNFNTDYIQLEQQRVYNELAKLAEGT